jgi:hypothetical protein
MKRNVDETDSPDETDQFFKDHRARADFETFDRIMQRSGGQPPIPGDELPE